jgi:hypothetical protein
MNVNGQQTSEIPSVRTFLHFFPHGPGKNRGITITSNLNSASIGASLNRERLCGGDSDHVALLNDSFVHACVSSVYTSRHFR